MKDPAIFAASMKAKGFMLTPHGWIKASRVQKEVRPKMVPEKLGIEPIYFYTLPYPPVLNHYYVHTKRGVFLSAKGRDYKKDIASVFWLSSVKPMQGALMLSITAYRPAKRGDVDSILKCLMDSLEGCLYENDRQIEELHVYRRDDKDKPRVELSLKKL